MSASHIESIGPERYLFLSRHDTWCSSILEVGSRSFQTFILEDLVEVQGDPVWWTM